MKKIISVILLALTGVICLPAQQQQYELPEMGMALRYEQNVEGLYATHRTHPFGTRLMITNMLYNTQLEVQVGGRPSANSRALIEISPLACDNLGIEPGVLTQVLIEVVSKPVAAPAMRSRLEVEQTGIAIVQDSPNGDLAAYHPSIPINTNITLTNTENGKSVNAVVKGRIQAARGHIVEISHGTAQALGITGSSGEVHLKTH